MTSRPDHPDDRAGTRWLTDREQRLWRTFMSATLELQNRLDQQLRAATGMPVAYYEILVILSESPGRELRMSRLAEYTNSSASRLSHAMNAMEKAGWVTRCSVEGDRRGTLARLTDAGWAALEEAAPGHVAEVRAVLFDALTPRQLDALEEISRALKDSLERRVSR
ncbi:MarR family transcriptional regulator [Streptomyces capparidis]